MYLKNKKVLIVEDEYTNYYLMKKILEAQGATITWAEDGKIAVKTAQDNEDLDLILMDLKLPEMNGLEATRKIRRFRPHINIIAVTAYAMKEDMIKAIEAGCNDFLAKPYKKDMLINKISLVANPA